MNKTVNKTMNKTVNKTVNKTMSAFLMVISVLAFSLHAEARRGQCEKDLHGSGMGTKMMEELGLSDKQKSQLESLRKDNKNEIKKLKADMKEARERLKASFKNNVSESKLLAAQAAVKDLRSQLSDLRFEKTLAIHKILTTQQREKFHELHGHHRGHKYGKHRDCKHRDCKHRDCKHRAKHCEHCEDKD